MASDYPPGSAAGWPPPGPVPPGQPYPPQYQQPYPQGYPESQQGQQPPPQSYQQPYQQPFQQSQPEYRQSAPGPGPSARSFPLWPWMAGLLGFLLGVVLMFFALSNQGKTPAAAATVTVTSAATPAPTVTTTQSVAPQACVDALDQADKGFEIAGSAFQAAAKYDSTALGKASEQLKTLAPQYNATKAQCRAAK